jgi:chitodextrinase
VPTNLAVTAVSAAQLDLAWSAATDNVGVPGYKIYRGGTLVTSATGTAWQNTGLSAGTQYCYTVAAVDAAGNTSAQTSQVCANTRTLADAADNQPPTIPTGLTATAISASQIGLTWSASSDNIGVTGYKVYRAGSEIVSSVITNYQNGGLTPNTNYCYTVSAYDAAGNTSAQTTQACVTTQSGVITDSSAPSVPTNLAVTAISSTQINLSWTPSTDNVAVTGYTLYQSGVQLATNAATSYQNTGLTASTQYCYSVIAQDAAGNSSAQTAQLCATTQAASVVVATDPLNDTGIDKWRAADSNELTASPAGYPGRDADYGRDALARAGTLVKVGGGSAGFDFTKIGSNGSALSAGSATWSCVRDNVTGLIWEVKTNDGGLHDMNNYYTFSNMEAYVVAVNSAGLCGASNWRLPSVEELYSLVDLSKAYPDKAIDSSYFPNTASSVYLSSSQSAGFSLYYVDYGYNGEVGRLSGYYDYNFRLRLVRGGQ